MMSGSDTEPSLNPFASRKGREETKRGLYDNVPNMEDDENDGFLESGKKNKFGEERMQSMLPNSPGQCQFLMVSTFLIGAMAALFVVVGSRNSVAPHVDTPTSSTLDGSSTGIDRNNAEPALKAAPFYYSEVFDPFQLSTSASSNYAALFTPPSTATFFDTGNNAHLDQGNLGFLSQPSVFNNTLVFICEGDVYISSINSQDATSAHPASRLTQTVGNVLTPKINPKYPYLIAFSASYTASRELYLMDLRQDYRRPAQRLTYIPGGIRQVISWSPDGKSILFSAHNQNVGLPNTKLYSISINTSPTPDSSTRQRQRHTLQQPKMAGAIESLPLAQAVDGVKHGPCLYFVRYKQSSKTFRYLGGTAENLWGYCNNKQNAVRLYDYNGTTRAPSIYQDKYLLFISDRYYENNNNDESTSTTSTLNLFAIPLPSMKQMYNPMQLESWSAITPLQLTAISCQEGTDGQQLMEYTVDQETGHVVLRIGADFQILEAVQIQTALDAAFGKHRRLEDNDNDNDNKPTQTESPPDQSTPTPTSQTTSTSPTKTLTSKALPIAVYSDFNLQQERRFSVNLPHSLNTVDIFPTLQEQNYALLAVRGQAFVSPILSKTTPTYTGMGQMLPPRSYKLIPSSTLGGITRVLAVKYIPSSIKFATPKALVLATDPLSETSEHAIYLLPCDTSTKPHFSVENMPIPILGGHTSTGGSSKDGGLGSVDPDTFEVSPCGRRAAWVDKDGRITVMTIPTLEEDEVEKLILPAKNDRGEPISGYSEISWSPGGRYLAIEHGAKNQFSIISIADLSDPDGDTAETTNNTTTTDNETPALNLKGIYQATPSRFNSGDAIWGHGRSTYSNLAPGESISSLPADTLYFLTDRDIVSDVSSPWGTRAPLPHFKKEWVVYALPLEEKKTTDYTIHSELNEKLSAPYPNGGATELLPVEEDLMMTFLELESLIDMDSNDTNSSVDDDDFDLSSLIASRFMSRPTPDLDIHFGKDDDDDDEISSLDGYAFARKAFRIGSIPPGKYAGILTQLSDNPSLVLFQKTGPAYTLKVFQMSQPDAFSQNGDYEDIDFPILTIGGGLSTSRKHFYLTVPEGVQVVQNTFSGLLDLLDTVKDDDESSLMVDSSNMILSIYPKLEYQQMFADAWRMMRDYFYDPNMHGVDWPEVFHRYQPLVARCTKREDLDDILSQMGSEVSALHVFVYGGEYEDPTHGVEDVKKVNDVASLGATFSRDEELGGYKVEEVHLPDPDFAAMDENAIYSPLSNKVMRLSGQKGLKAGDTIVSINGENVMAVPDMHMLLRGSAGNSVRLEILRKGQNLTEPMVTVPISGSKASGLRYSAWEYRTRVNAMKLANENGFSCGYIHLRDMDGEDSIDAFTRNFFPDYDKQALIIDVRHNNGGSIDSWLITELQRRAWNYFQGRATNVNNGGLGWNEQFAFRGHLVVLVDENTASDGEGFSRGVMELGLGKTVGVRTWGGGIWLSSDNHLVDRGILTAPEIGVYNNEKGWGMGIENMGVDPDVVVDNDPRQVELGNDLQLQKAIEVLKDWLKEEPIVLPNDPGPHPNTSLKRGTCQ